MLFSQVASTLALGLLSSSLVTAQTYSKCNPLKQQCPADPALGTSKTIDFTSGQSSDFTASGNSITYGSNGAEMTVAKSGDSPLLISNWYLMFGKVEYVMKATPGTGLVTSAVLESDDLDEIDWEMLGSQPDQVQTNYFGKGQTGSYDRGGTSANPGSQTTFKTYTIEWTATQIVWSIDGQTTRVLSAANANGQFPQTPMRIKIGPWAGGDPSNAPGVTAWAGGATNYAQGPFKMYVKSVSATDYSTGTSYSYSGTDGTWQQVKSSGGHISGGPSNIDTSGAPAQVTTTSGQPVPFAGTHAEPSSSASLPSIYPWVSQASTFTSVSAAATSVPGLPAGWSVSSSGKVVPPSSAPVSKHLRFLVARAAAPAALLSFALFRPY